MQKAICSTANIALLVLGVLTIMAQTPADRHRPFLAVLKAGQSVSMKDVSGKYEISTVEGVAAVQGHKVVEIGSDFVVVQDIFGVTESRIPVHSIKAIIRLKVPTK